METILVADNSKFVADNICNFLKNNGKICQACTTGEATLAVFSDTEISTLILDADIKDIDSIQIISELKKRKKSLKIIGIGQNTNNERIKAMEKEGAFEFLKKPIVLKELKDLI